MSQIESLSKRYPLPEPCKDLESFREEFQVGPKRVALVGLACDLGGRMVTASAGGARAERRAYFELVERTSIVSAEASGRATFAATDARGNVVPNVPYESVFPVSDAPDRWRFAKSNGVAVHGTRRGAALRALREVIERDRVLRSWFGGARPVRLEVKIPLQGSFEARYDVRAYRFEALEGFEVAGVFWFPRTSESVLAYGFGCGPSVREAVMSATREGVQRLGFLSGEALPADVPELVPAADFHQEWFLYPPHQRYLTRWLDGGHDEGRSLAAPRVGEAVFADLTPPSLTNRLFVVKALVPGAVSLRFGDVRDYAPGWPKELLVHPIA